MCECKGINLSAPPLLQKFNRWIDEQRAASPQPGLSVYPEGERAWR